MSLFKKIGKGIGKVAKGAVKVTGGILKTAAPIVSIVPGIGTLVGGAAGIVGELISPTKQASIENAVERDNVVEVHRIEETIKSANPSISSNELKQATKEMTLQAVKSVPTATINDSQSSTEIGFATKAFQWVKANIVIVGISAIGLIFFLSNNKGKKKTFSRKKY